MENFLARNGHIKRPMNPFMIFAKEQRSIMKKIFPHMTNCQISTLLGNTWRALNEEDRQRYVDHADRLSWEHRRLFPDYEFRPQKLQSHAKVPNASLDGQVSRVGSISPTVHTPVKKNLTMTSHLVPKILPNTSPQCKPTKNEQKQFTQAHIFWQPSTVMTPTTAGEIQTAKQTVASPSTSIGTGTSCEQTSCIQHGTLLAASEPRERGSVSVPNHESAWSMFRVVPRNSTHSQLAKNTSLSPVTKSSSTKQSAEAFSYLDFLLSDAKDKTSVTGQNSLTTTDFSAEMKVVSKGSQELARQVIGLEDANADQLQRVNLATVQMDEKRTENQMQEQNESPCQLSSSPNPLARATSKVNTDARSMLDISDDLTLASDLSFGDSLSGELFDPLDDLDSLLSTSTDCSDLFAEGYCQFAADYLDDKLEGIFDNDKKDLNNNNCCAPDLTETAIATGGSEKGCSRDIEPDYTATEKQDLSDISSAMVTMEACKGHPIFGSTVGMAAYLADVVDADGKVPSDFKVTSVQSVGTVVNIPECAETSAPKFIECILDDMDILEEKIHATSKPLKRKLMYEETEQRIKNPKRLKSGQHQLNVPAVHDFLLDPSAIMTNMSTFLKPFP